MRPRQLGRVLPRRSGHVARRWSRRGRDGRRAVLRPTRRRCRWRGLRILWRQATDLLSKAVYIIEQVCIEWHRTGAYYAAKLTFSHDIPIKVWYAYYTSVRIIVEFLRYAFV